MVAINVGLVVWNAVSLKVFLVSRANVVSVVLPVNTSVAIVVKTPAIVSYVVSILVLNNVWVTTILYSVRIDVSVPLNVDDDVL